MAFAFVKVNSVLVAAATSAGIAFTGGTTAGNFLIFQTANYAGDITSVTSTGDTPAQEAVFTSALNGSQVVQLWTVRSASGGATTVTQTGTASAFRTLVVIEHSGSPDTGLHKSAHASGFSAAPDSGNIVPTVDGCLIWGGTQGHSNLSPYTPDAGYTEQADLAGSQAVHCQTFVQTTAATINNSPAGTTTGEWEAVIVAWSPAPATYEQEGYRWRNDDGSETAATWVEAQDTGMTAPISVNRRLRVLVDTAAVDPTTQTMRLEYKEDSEAAGLWRPVGTVTLGAMPAYSGTGQAAAVVNATITTAILPAKPSTVNAGDLLILQVMARNDNSDGAGPTSITDWTAFAGNPYGGSNNSRQSLYWRIAGAGEASQTVSVACTGGTTNDLAMARIYRFTATNGFHPVPIEAISTNAGTASPLAAPANVTPVGLNRLAVCMGALASSDATIGSFTGESAGNWTEAVTGNSTTGGDGTLNVQTADASAGTAISGGSIAFTLSTSAHWNTVGFCLVPAVSAIIISPSANITASGENTTAQLTAPASGSFGGGRMQDDEVTADTVDLALNEYGEWEWCLQATALALTSDVYQFRVTRAGTLLNTYTVTPTWTIGTPASATVMAQARSVMRRVAGRVFSRVN